jgi:geranylgeranyl pyrophosphate synthase
MCFQIVDDVLDVTATEDVLGKPAGQDLMEGVYTLPVIYALAESAPLRQLLAQPLDADRLVEARKLATSNGSVEAAIGVARSHAIKAGDALAGAEGLDADVCDALDRLVRGLVDRDS